MSTMGTGAVTTGAQATPTAATTGAQQQQKKTADPLQPTYVNPNVFSPKATLAQIMQGYQPAARQQQGALNNQLAAMGIQGGGAQSADQLLAAQQTSALAPTLANAIQGSQGMQLSAAQGNQQAADAMRSQLAQYLQQAWQIPYQTTAGLYGSAMGSGLQQTIGSQFPVVPQESLLSMIGI